MTDDNLQHVSNSLQLAAKVGELLVQFVQLIKAERYDEFVAAIQASPSIEMAASLCLLTGAFLAGANEKPNEQMLHAHFALLRASVSRPEAKRN